MKRYVAFVILFVFMFSIAKTSYACTVINASDGNNTLVGNNEDGVNTDAKAYFLPPENGKYGAVLFGFDDAFIQGGMNDQGLFIDWATEDHQNINFPRNGIYYKGNYNILYESNLNEKILRSCSNLNEVIDMYKKYNEIAFRDSHVMVVDETGASAIIEPYNGKLNILRKENKYQFMTNFNISASKSNGYFCIRYSLLTDSFKTKDDVTVDYFRSLLEKVSPPFTINGPITAYSNIYDLINGDIYIYYLKDFSNVMKLNLKEELSKGKHIYDLKTVFHRKQPVINSVNVNNLSRFSYKLERNRILFSVDLLILAIWTIVSFIMMNHFRIKRLNGLRFSFYRCEAIGILISFLNSLSCFILLCGLIKYGFYIRYGFTFYQRLLLSLPPVIIGLTLIQLIFLIYSWKKLYWTILVRVLYTGTTIYFILTSINMQSWCWHLF